MDDQQLIDSLSALGNFYQLGESNLYKIHKKNPERFQELIDKMNKHKAQGMDMSIEASGRFTPRKRSGFIQLSTDKGNTARFLVPIDKLDNPIYKNYIIREDLYKPHTRNQSGSGRSTLIPKKKKKSGGIIKKVYNNTSRKAKY